MLPTPECRDNTLPIHGVRRDWFVPGINLPTKPDDWHQGVEVCKVNGKRPTPLVPNDAREKRVFVTLPEPARAWGAAHGFTSAPTGDCSDVYRGRLMQIQTPGPDQRITIGQTLQVTGSAYSDDFTRYTLEVGQGDNPNTWTTISDQRVSVDKALLGVWNTAGLQPGRYRLRLRVFDRLLHGEEGPPVFVTLGPPPNAMPQPNAVPPAVNTATRSSPAPATAIPAKPTPQPAAQPNRSPLPWP
jgi:hypothetical protein